MGEFWKMFDPTRRRRRVDEDREREWEFKQKQFNALQAHQAFQDDLAVVNASRAAASDARQNVRDIQGDLNAMLTRQDATDIRSDATNRYYGELKQRGLERTEDIERRGSERKEDRDAIDNRFDIERMDRLRNRDEDRALTLSLQQRSEAKDEDRDKKAEAKELRTTVQGILNKRDALSLENQATVTQSFDSAYKHAMAANSQAASQGAPLPFPNPQATAARSSDDMAAFLAGNEDEIGRMSLRQLADVRDLHAATTGGGDPALLDTVLKRAESRPASRPTKPVIAPPSAESVSGALSNPKAATTSKTLRQTVDEPIAAAKTVRQQFDIVRADVETGVMNDPEGFSKVYSAFLSKFGLADSPESQSKWLDSRAADLVEWRIKNDRYYQNMPKDAPLRGVLRRF